MDAHDPTTHPRRPVVWFVSWGIPEPFRGGQRTYGVLRRLSEIADVTLIDIGDDAGEVVDVAIASYRYDGQRFPRIPSWWRRTLPDTWIQGYRSVADEYLTAAELAGVDILYFATWELIPTRKANPASGVKIVWHYDAFSTYHASRRASRTVRWVSRAHSAWLARRYSRIEHDVAKVSDVVAVPSELDAAAFRVFQECEVVTLPNETYAVRRISTPYVYDFGFLGSAWQPNQDGMDWFLRTVWPRVRAARPKATFALAGSIRAGEIPGVTALGMVEDKAEFYSQVTALVVPVDYGSGTQTKFLEIAEFEIPIFTTAFSAHSTLLRNLTPFLSKEEWVTGLVAHLDGVRDPVVADSVPTAEQGLRNLLRCLGVE